MSHRLFLRTVPALAALTIAAGFLTPPAHAQDSGWLWGGGFSVGGSGKEHVSLRTNYGRGTIVVSFGDRKLYYVTGPNEAISYPIAIPRDESRWQGNTVVSQKRMNPSWTPTARMRAENPRLPSFVPGGHPMNPMGPRALYLGSSAYRIHGTDAPWTIGTNVSKGCIRMYDADAIDLYNRVPVGARVVVTWQSFRGGVATASAPRADDGEQAQRRRVTRAPARRTVRAKSADASGALSE